MNAAFWFAFGAYCICMGGWIITRRQLRDTRRERDMWRVKAGRNL